MRSTEQRGKEMQRIWVGVTEGAGGIIGIMRCAFNGQKCVLSMCCSYYELAHSVREEIIKPPTLLKPPKDSQGQPGTLRDYQVGSI